MLNKYGFVLFCLLFVGCQSQIDKVGQEHADEVLKWQELARYAGNELKYLGLTVTAGVQINQTAEGTTYSIINVQLNRDANHTEVDLLSPEFAEKFACGEKCQELGLYESNIIKPETSLTNFFFTEEGRFFEFYGKLTRLNNTLADYRASSPDILKKYLTLKLNRKLVFNSLLEFIDDLETYVTEDKLLAFSKSGFISPVEDRLSPTFFDDLTASFPDEWIIDTEVNTEMDMDGNVPMPDDNWNSATLTPDEMFYEQLLSKAATETVVNVNVQLAAKRPIQVGSIACSVSDNSFGMVERLENNQATLKMIAQARIKIDGMMLYPQPGYLFTSPESFYFVKAPPNKTYPLSDIATCNIEHLKRGQKLTGVNNIDFVLNQ